MYFRFGRLSLSITNQEVVFIKPSKESDLASIWGSGIRNTGYLTSKLGPLLESSCPACPEWKEWFYPKEGASSTARVRSEDTVTCFELQSSAKSMAQSFHKGSIWTVVNGWSDWPTKTFFFDLIPTVSGPKKRNLGLHLLNRMLGKNRLQRRKLNNYYS